MSTFICLSLYLSFYLSTYLSIYVYLRIDIWIDVDMDLDIEITRDSSEAGCKLPDRQLLEMPCNFHTVSLVLADSFSKLPHHPDWKYQGRRCPSMEEAQYMIPDCQQDAAPCVRNVLETSRQARLCRKA